MKEMTNVASTVMTEEEKAELHRDMKAPNPQTTAVPTVSPSDADTSPASVAVDEKTHLAPDQVPPPTPADASHSPKDDGSGGMHISPGTSPAPSSSTSPAPHDSSKLSASSEDLRKKKGKQKLTPEQKQKLEELEIERRKAMEARVKKLTDKVIERIRPFVDAERPGDPNDPETIAFQKKMQLEADDLKLESFGVEVWFITRVGYFNADFMSQLLHTIGNVYMVKATSFMKSRKFLGM